MSEIFWKKDHILLLSVELLLMEHEDDVDLFQIAKVKGIELLCWGMKRIAH